jgi:hypothetical protein
VSKVSILLVIVLVVAAPSALSQSESHNMRLVGFHGLSSRSAYQPVIHEHNGRWLAYVGHHAGAQINSQTGRTEPNGTSILDVTDPKNPMHLAHVSVETGGGAQMVRICNGKDLPEGDTDKVYMLRSSGHSSHELWDVTVPQKPEFLVTVVKGLNGTHKSWWECDTGIAYLVSGVPGWRTHRMTQVYNLANPSKPTFIRNFGLPGQQPGSTGPVPTGLHGSISTGPHGNRVYFGHGTSNNGILQIVDRNKLLNGPKELTRKSLLHPQVGRFDLPVAYGAHSVFPVIGVKVNGAPSAKPDGARDFVVITNEALSEGCVGSQQHVWIVEVTEESRPVSVAQWRLDLDSGEYCRRGGRVGSHSSHQNFTPIYYGRVMFIAHFNAGVRAVDIRNPYRPREIAYYVPAADGWDAVATNNVEVDDRGYIYIVDRGSLGLHILELTGEARRAANFE